MFRFSALAILASIFVLSHVDAQPTIPGGGGSRPTFSPYINLLGGGSFNNPALSYFGIVRPQQQYQQQLGQLQQQLTTSNQQITSLVGEQQQQMLMPFTGNVPVFNNYAGYFNRLGVGSGSAMGGGGQFNRVGGGMMAGGMPGGGMSGGGRSGLGGGLGNTGGGGLGNAPSFSRPSQTPSSTRQR